MNEIIFLKVLVFLCGLMFSGITLDEIIGNILKSVREKTTFIFPVGYAIAAIVAWTAFYAFSIINF